MTWEGVLGTVFVTSVSVVLGGGIIGWIIKKTVGSVIKQNEQLINAALKNMEANTNAISVNTDSIRQLAHQYAEDIKIRHERDKSLFRILEAIERRVEKF